MYAKEQNISRFPLLFEISPRLWPIPSGRLQKRVRSAAIDSTLWNSSEQVQLFTTPSKASDEGSIVHTWTEAVAGAIEAEAAEAIKRSSSLSLFLDQPRAHSKRTFTFSCPDQFTPRFVYLNCTLHALCRQREREFP